MENKTVEILWTGGFDSTFRIVQLSRMPVTIQPYYLIFDTRKTTDQELSAISNISNILNKRVETKCKLLPLITIEVSTIKISEDVKEAYKEIRKNTFLGDQYLPIAEFAKIHKGIEICVEKHVDKQYVWGNYKMCVDDNLDKYSVFDKIKTPLEVYTLFQNLIFPISHLSKSEMKQLFIDWGYKDVMNLTWFCHYPIKNKPCGCCNPCRCTIEGGLFDRFSITALFRYYWLITKVRLKRLNDHKG